MVAIALTWISTVQASSGNLQFEDVYDKPLWQNGWVIAGVITATAIGAAVVTTMTAGTGAPAAAAGVSTVASTLAGGGAGSYMAGLSMVGGLVGGNAIVGAAILNGIAASLIGSSALKGIPMVVVASLEVAQKLGMVAIPNPEKKIDQFLVTMPITTDVGSNYAQDLVEEFKDNTDKYKDEEITETDYLEKNKYIAERATRFLKSVPSPTDENAVVALILIRNLGYIDEFDEYAHILQCQNDASFTCYLQGVAYLDKGNYEKAIEFADYAIRREEDVIEPIIIKIMALNGLGKYSSSMELEKNIEDYDEGNYVTPISKATAYNLLGDYSSRNLNHSYAANYYVKAFDDLGFNDSDELKAILCAKAAHSYRLSTVVGFKDNAEKYYKKAISYSDSDELKKTVDAIYYSQG